MNPRNTLILAGVFVLLVVGIKLGENSGLPTQSTTPSPTALPQIYSLSPANVKTIDVRDLHMVRDVQLDRTANGWQITKPDNVAADSAAVDSALSQLTNLQANRVLTDVTDLKPFGLVTATLEVRLIMTDTTPYALTVGDKTPDGSSYYVVYTGDKSKVFTVSSYALDTLMGWLNLPPYQPTPTPTLPPSPTAAPTEAGTPGATPSPGGTPIATPTP